MKKIGLTTKVMKTILNAKRDLNYIYDQKIGGIKIKSKYNRYENGERSSKPNTFTKN